jgi:hypothetical protein
LNSALQSALVDQEEIDRKFQFNLFIDQWDESAISNFEGSIDNNAQIKLQESFWTNAIENYRDFYVKQSSVNEKIKVSSIHELTGNKKNDASSALNPSVRQIGGNGEFVVSEIQSHSEIVPLDGSIPTFAVLRRPSGDSPVFWMKAVDLRFQNGPPDLLLLTVCASSVEQKHDGPLARPFSGLPTIASIGGVKAVVSTQWDISVEHSQKLNQKLIEAIEQSAIDRKRVNLAILLQRSIQGYISETAVKKLKDQEKFRRLQMSSAYQYLGVSSP